MPGKLLTRGISGEEVGPRDTSPLQEDSQALAVLGIVEGREE